MLNRPYALVLTVVVILASGVPAEAADQMPAASSTSNSSAVPFAGNSAGGYIRGPKNKRVIVFVNGIFGDAISTWKNDAGAYWPKLIEDDQTFDDADIYVHSFQSPKLSSAHQIMELADRLRDYLAVDNVFRTHEQIVFLVHSMGGLVTRAMIVKSKLPPSKIPMIFFFATPSAGADVAAIGGHVSENPQLRDMLPLDEGGYVKYLREEWLETSSNPKLNYPNTIASFCAYEGQDTMWHVRIVSEVSATYLCNRETRSVDADHFQIVKPKDERGEPYVYFKAAYERTFEGTSQAIADVLYGETTRWTMRVGEGGERRCAVRLKNGLSGAMRDLHPTIERGVGAGELGWLRFKNRCVTALII